MLKRTITKTEYDALPDPLKTEYVASKGQYALDVEPDPQIASLNNDLSAARRELTAKENFVDPTTIVSTDEVSNQLKAEKEGRASDVRRLQGLIGNSLIEAKSSEIAAKISKSPGVMKRILKDYLTVDFSKDNPTVKVRGKDGNASETSFEDFENEMLANPEFSDIIIGGKGNGGQVQHVPTQTQFKGGEKPDLSTMSPEQIAAHMKSKKGTQ